LLKTGQVSNYCAMHGICLLNRAISPTFLPLYPGHNSTTLTYRRVHCVKGERRWNNSRPHIQEDCQVKFRTWPCFRSSRLLPGLLSLIYSLLVALCSRMSRLCKSCPSMGNLQGCPVLTACFPNIPRGPGVRGRALSLPRTHPDHYQGMTQGPDNSLNLGLTHLAYFWLPVFFMQDLLLTQPMKKI
jgi:hypothetical protein